MNEDSDQSLLPDLRHLFDGATREGMGGGKPKADFNRVANTADPFAHEFLNRRIVRLTGPITDAKASQVIACMQLLADIDPESDIELRINSPGGSVTAGLAIYDAMKDLPCDIKTVGEGVCASMAAVLLAAGTPGKRFAMPNCSVMVHGVSAGAEGKLADVKITAREMERLQKTIVDIMSQYSGMPVNYLDYLMLQDNFMSAQDAKKLGLIDEIRQPRQKPPANKILTGGPFIPPSAPNFGSPSIN